MDVQTLLLNGTPDIIRREVELRRQFHADGGLFLGPSHAIQVDTPLENILAMYWSAGSLQPE
jgi:uroporphyrinogen decarboxylase